MSLWISRHLPAGWAYPGRLGAGGAKAGTAQAAPGPATSFLELLSSNRVQRHFLWFSQRVFLLGEGERRNIKIFLFFFFNEKHV